MHGVTQDRESPRQRVSMWTVPLLVVIAVSWLLGQAAEVQGQSIIGPGEQRVLQVFGEVITLKFGGAQTDGKYAVIEEVSRVGGGPPLHVHRHEDEIVYVLDGDVEFQLGDQRVRAKAGSTAFLPRDIPHTFRNVGATPSKVLMVIVPARLVGFFEEVDALTRPTPEQAMELGKKYGLTFLPPPKGN
ncbi:MAG: cupin domain-containing protein [Candidatus Methylomirabilaceae bacterium]